jgi:hypothetical protein
MRVRDSWYIIHRVCELWLLNKVGQSHMVCHKKLFIFSCYFTIWCQTSMVHLGCSSLTTQQCGSASHSMSSRTGYLWLLNNVGQRLMVPRLELFIFDYSTMWVRDSWYVIKNCSSFTTQQCWSETYGMSSRTGHLWLLNNVGQRLMVCHLELVNFDYSTMWARDSW